MKDLILLVRKGDVEELPLGPARPPLAWLALNRDGGVVHFLNKSGSCLMAKLILMVTINRLPEYVAQFVVSDDVSIH